MSHTFFDNSKPMIVVDDFYDKNDKICDIGIITFSKKVLEWTLEHCKWEKVAEI